MNLRAIALQLQRSDFGNGVATGVMAILLIILIYSLTRRPSARFQAFTTDSGKILISRKALEEQIERCCAELDEVGRCRAKISRKKKQVSTRIEIRLRSNSRLVGVSGNLQQRIRHLIRSDLGIENIGPIDIIVTGIVSGTVEKTTSLTPDSSQ